MVEVEYEKTRKGRRETVNYTRYRTNVLSTSAWIPLSWSFIVTVQCTLYILYRARIFKRLWSLGIDSKEWIPPAYVAWRAGTITYSSSVPSPHRLFKSSSSVNSWYVHMMVLELSVSRLRRNRQQSSWRWCISKRLNEIKIIFTRVAHSYGFGPPWSGSGSVSQRYRSRSFYHQAKPWLWLSFNFIINTVNK